MIGSSDAKCHKQGETFDTLLLIGLNFKSLELPFVVLRQ